MKEHLAHSGNCNWALSCRAGAIAQQHVDTAEDPMSEELIAARRGTFEKGASWPHESKRGWKCKVGKMIEAGWCYDPAPAEAADMGEEEEADGVTCFYCNLSLDGWEPKDDPKVEHQRRSPGCAFFALVEKYGGGVQKKTAKGRGKKGTSRASTASKASSRLSTQSAISTFSQEPSFADIGMGLEADVETEMEGAAMDDSIMSTASQATTTGATKGKKKAGRAKAAPKGAKGRKRAGTVDSQVEAGPIYPDLGAQSQSQAQDEDDLRLSSQAPPLEEAAPAPAKKGRKVASKQPQVDSSVVEVSSMDVSGAPKKTRGRKPKAQPEPEPETQPEARDYSDVSAQLQEELERTMDFDAQPDLDDTTPQPEEIVRPKRGAKRTSDGLVKKYEVERNVSAVIVEFPVPPKPAVGAKGKKARQASKQMAAAVEESLPEAEQEQPNWTREDAVMSDVEVVVTKPTKAKKAPTKGKGRKASSTRSSRSSKATVVDTEPEQPETQEDLDRDEREIEAELERIAAEQAALQAEQENTADFEPSPSHKHVAEIPSAASSKAGSRRQSTQAKPSSPPQLPPMDFTTKNATPSPTSSDKENQPSSAFVPLTAKQTTAPAILLSPTKTTRIPLAPGTPNRALLSPSKRLLSPTKQLRQLASTQPWQPIDLENVLLMSPQPTPGTLATRLAGAAGALTTPEKGLTVEGWVMLQAEKAEGELRRKCEEMVGVFEREGVRALGGLQGIVVGGA